MNQLPTDSRPTLEANPEIELKLKQQGVAEWIESKQPLEHPVEISVLVPAYNERWRLPPTLVEIIDYLDAQEYAYELIVVDDGSRDDTADMVRRFEKIRPQLRLIRLPKNYGKGHAVRLGALNAKGRYVLFADADGSTPIDELEKLRAEIIAGAQIAIGSRAMQSQQTKVVSRFYRKLLGRSFNFFVNLLLLPDIADTQCGFKMFESHACRYLFERQQSDGFSFDLELLYLARKSGLTIKEIPVNWHHSPGSKVNLIVDSLKMFYDLWVFKIRHRLVNPEEYKEFMRRVSAS